MSRAITWYEMKKYPEALEDYTAVLKVDSTSIAYAYYNRALLRSEIGDVNNAIQDFDQVLEMNPDNILIYFNRGLLKMEIKDYEGAYNDFSQSISIYPDFVKAYLARIRRAWICGIMMQPKRTVTRRRRSWIGIDG